MGTIKRHEQVQGALRMTPKQELFVAEYLMDLNATQAAIRAGYSKKTAAETGYENLRKPHILEAVLRAKENRIARINLDADMVLRSLGDLYAVDMGHFLHIPTDGSQPTFNLAGATPEQIAAVSSLKIKSRTVVGDPEAGIPDQVFTEVEIKLPDKLKTMELIGRHVNVQAWTDRHGLTGEGADRPTSIDTSVQDMGWIEIARRVAFVIATGAEMERHGGPVINGEIGDANARP